MTEFTKEDIEYYRKQYALWTSRLDTTPQELHLIGRLRDALDHIEHLQQRIAELEAERQWIPAKGLSERIRALVYMGNDYTVIATHFTANNCYRWKNDCGQLVKNVLFYQPLPQPPKEGE